MTLDQLEALGFDRSVSVGDGHNRVRCSQCSAVVVNGVPCHEHGCPNRVNECRGCSNIVPFAGAYCEDCQ